LVDGALESPNLFLLRRFAVRSTGAGPTPGGGAESDARDISIA